MVTAYVKRTQSVAETTAQIAREFVFEKLVKEGAMIDLGVLLGGQMVSGIMLGLQLYKQDPEHADRVLADLVDFQNEGREQVRSMADPGSSAQTYIDFILNGRVPLDRDRT